MPTSGCAYVLIEAHEFSAINGTIGKNVTKLQSCLDTVLLSGQDYFD
jgi:hypothetical protein